MIHSINSITQITVGFVKKALRIAKSIAYVDSIKMLFDNKICLRWANDKQNRKNFGDALSPVLLEKITGRKSVCSWNVINLLQKPVICFVGSVLDNLNRKNSVICGAGFQHENAAIKVSPARVIAVRGPLSREVFIRNQVQCAETYGDPAILLPYFYQPTSPSKKWDVGIIAHYADKELLNNLPIHDSGYSFKFIDIESPIESVINDICSSRFILSSSLHGIITAHAYRVNATWIKLSDNVIGGDFKFRDYALSTGSVTLDCYEIDESINLEHAINLSVLFEVRELAENLYRVVTNHFGTK